MIDDPRSHPHLSAALLATGEARFVRDEPRPRDLLFASPVPGPVPHGRLLGVDAREALARPGVVRVVTAADIPGENQLGEVADDEPLLAAGTVDYAGQPVALVLAESGRAARDAARLVRIGCEELEPVLTIEEALARDMLYAPERRIERGEVEAGFAAADLVLEGVIRTPAQEHLYLETQSSRALPAEGGGIILYCATQSPADVQQLAARTLGIAHKDVTVEVRRVGGGFGGKETNATRWACLAALGCRLTGRPVELTLTRAEDIAWTGKRHPFETRYKAGFSAAGRLLAYAVDFSINGGASTDLSMAVLERAMLHADNAYYVPHVRIVGRACRTNLPPNTAMRGFGAPQGIFAVESVMELAARRLGIDPARLRRLNAYADGQETPCGQPVPDARTPELLDRLLAAAGYDRLRGAVDEYNRTHPHHRRGIGVVPVKFGISFTASFKNQGSALVWAFRDGTVSVSHGGVEMGQGVNTRVAQVVAAGLGIAVGRVRVESNNSSRIANASPTAASTGADVNGGAARIAAARLAARLREFAGRQLGAPAGAVRLDNDAAVAPDGRRVPFPKLCHDAHAARVGLGAYGFYATPGVNWDRAGGRGTPFSYYVFGCCLAVAEVDLLTGATRLVKAHILHDTGPGLNPALDRGQIAGAFVQGFGWTCMEQLIQERGRCLTDTLSTYKIPGIRDLPADFTIELDERESAAAGVLGSKAVGEPPFIYGLAPFFAVRDAVAAAAGREVALRMPAIPENVLAALRA